MKKNEIFTFTAPNGVEVIDLRMKGLGATHVCLYARLPEFTVLGMNRVIYQ